MNSEWDYEAIKKFAKENGMSVKELLALSPGNDPFYVGSPGQLEKAKWFADIYEKLGRPLQCHTRRAHYWLVSQPVATRKGPGGKSYENTKNDENLMNLASKYARYAGLVPIDNIVDRRNPEPIINIYGWNDRKPTEIKEGVSAESIIEDIVSRFHCWNEHNTQPYHIEIWCEKSTMNDVLVPLGEKYGINVITGLGELSITAVYQLIQRIKRISKPVLIFYVSDFDPAGECMPISIARKIEYFIRLDGMREHVRLKQVMLTSDQCKKYKLPRTPIKETERRKDGFETRHGIGATELDALEALMPGEMFRLIEEEILKYFDIEAWNNVIRKNKEIQQKIRTFLQDKIGNVLEKLDVEKYDEFDPPRGNETDDDEENWLYDSLLGYMDQMERYKLWRKKND